MSHECNFYCSDDSHAIQVYSTGELTLNTVRARMRTMGIDVLDVFPARESSRNIFFGAERGRLAVSSKAGIVYPLDMDLDKFQFAYIILIRFNKEVPNDDTK